MERGNSEHLKHFTIKDKGYNDKYFHIFQVKDYEYCSHNIYIFFNTGNRCYET